MPRDIDIGEDIDHQRKVWKLERIAWTVMAGSIIAAVCGFAGHGLFSERTVAPREGDFIVDYQRFERYHAQTQLTLHLTGDTADETRIHFGADFLRNVEVMRLEPEPERAELGANATAYVFNTDAAGRIVVHYKPIVSGRLPLVLGRDDAPLLYLEQFVYP
ncbi:MAG TPA: hypothetical protein VGE69_07000 [Pseudomonadales bacterium]